jgi:hypothetical protein
MLDLPRPLRPQDAAGGCTTQQLAAFERAVISFARATNRPLLLRLHPRDSILKFVVRHRSLAPCAYLGSPWRREGRAGRLVLSSYSSALTTNTRTGDHLLNVELAPVSEVVRMEYGWLPSVGLDQLLKRPDRLPVFQRG